MDLKYLRIENFLIPPHPLANFEILNKMKDRAYIVISDEYSDTGTHWIALNTLKDVTFFWQFWCKIYLKKT